MKLRLRVRRMMVPSDHTIGWKNHEPLVRLLGMEVVLARRLGIPPAAYAQELLNAYYRRNKNAKRFVH
jgi:hypothetical protein